MDLPQTFLKLFNLAACVLSGLKHSATPRVLNPIKHRRRSRGGEMGEFSSPLFLSRLLSRFFIPQTPQPGFGSITLLQKFTFPPPPPYFKILNPRLKHCCSFFKHYLKEILLSWSIIGANFFQGYLWAV